MRITLLSLSFVVLSASGCPDDAATDAGADSGEPPDAGLLVTPPDIPWLESGVPSELTPCPDGWREVRDGELTTCDPYPAEGPSDCVEGEAHFPAEEGCRPIGDPCPMLEFPEGLDESSPIVYVDPAAPAGGTGSRASPFASLAMVPWLSLTSGTTVALAKGTHEGAVLLNPGVQVVGACVAETTVTGDSSPTSATVSVIGRGSDPPLPPAVVRNLAIRSPPGAGVSAVFEQALNLRGVLISGATEYGVVGLTGARVGLMDVVVADVAPPASLAFGGSGVFVATGARLEATRVVIQGMRGLGLYVFAEDSEAVIEDFVVRDATSPAPEMFNSAAINVVSGRVVGTRVSLSGSYDQGLTVAGEGGDVVLTDFRVTNTQERAEGALGIWGVSVSRGARLELNRALVSDNANTGVNVFGGGSELVLRDTVVRRTTTPVLDGTGIGVVVSSGRLEATRLLVRENALHSLQAGRPDTEVMLTDVALSHSTLPVGYGVYAYASAAVSASRLVVSGHTGLGIYATGPGTALRLEDAVVRDTLPVIDPPRGGLGIQVGEGSSLQGSRVRVESSHEIGVLAVRAGEVALDDASVVGVVPRSCATSFCPPGIGVAAIGGIARLSRFEVHDADTCGVFVSEYALSEDVPSLDLSSGSVSGTAIGACVQVDGYDLSRLTDEVEYHDNGVNLDSTMLPVPEIPDPIEP